MFEATVSLRNWIFGLLRARQHDLGAAESIAAVHQRHFLAEPRKEVGLSIAESTPPITMIFLPR